MAHRGSRILPAGLVSKLNRGEVVSRTAVTVVQVAEEWLSSLEGQVAAKERSPRRLESYRYHLDARVLPALGQRKIQSVTVDRVAHLVTAWRAQGLSARTIQGTSVTLGHFGKLLEGGV